MSQPQPMDRAAANSTAAGIGHDTMQNDIEPMVAEGATNEPQHQSCRVAGCEHTLAQPQFRAQCTIRERNAIWQTESSKWAKHFRRQHRNNRQSPLQTVTAQQFFDAHHDTTLPWQPSLLVCESCNDLISKHNLAKHKASHKHIQAVAEQVETVRQAALDAEMQPPGAPLPPPLTPQALEDTEHLTAPAMNGH